MILQEIKEIMTKKRRLFFLRHEQDAYEQAVNDLMPVIEKLIEQRNDAAEETAIMRGYKKEILEFAISEADKELLETLRGK